MDKAEIESDDKLEINRVYSMYLTMKNLSVLGPAHEHLQVII